MAKSYPKKPHTDDFSETTDEQTPEPVIISPADPDDVTVAPLIPEITTPEQVSTFARFASLPPKQLSVLMAIGTDLVSENARTDAEIARDLGISRNTVINARENHQWSQALGVLVVGIARGRSDLYLRWTEKAAQDGKVSALKLLWEISGIYIQRTKNMNVNLDMSFNAGEAPKDYSDAVDEFLTALGESGWSSAQVAQRMNELKASGAW